MRSALHGPPPKLLEHTARVVLTGPRLRIGVVADTHSAPHEAGLLHLAQLKPDLLLHAGDIGDLAVLERLRAIAPLHVVRGNIDAPSRDLPDVLHLTLEHADGRRALQVLLTHIAVRGVNIRSDAAKLARAAQATLIVCGHSHVPFVVQEKGLTLFNPGSCGPRRFHLPVLFGVMELGPAGLTLRHHDCATGALWRP